MQRPFNPFFLPSFSVIALVALLLWLSVGTYLGDPAGVRLALMAVLLSLGALEHLLLILAPRRSVVTLPRPVGE
jgi:hypothetical protein